MQRYFAINKNLELSKDDYHHIKNVMRMKKGSIIEIVYDETIYECIIDSISPVSYTVRKKYEQKSDDIKIISVFALIKEQRLDYLFQKGTEAGIDTFIPVSFNRSIIKIDDSKKQNKIDRWNKICKEASEQSFRIKIPEIYNVKSLKDIIKVEADLKLLLSVNEKTKNIKKVLHNKNNCATILIVTGPEGGFDEREEQFLMDSGFISVSLGNNVLRAETAPVVAASMIKYEFMR